MKYRFTAWLLLLFFLQGAFCAAEGEAEAAPAAFSAAGYRALTLHRLERLYSTDIREAYRAVLKSTNRENFRGYCAMYVNNLLVYYGINRSYIKGNANVLYGIYSRKQETDGGYTVEATPMRSSNMEEILLSLSADGTPREFYLLAFSKGQTEKGKEFGHSVFINVVIGDTVVYSESAPVQHGDVYIQDGDPVVCSVAELVNRYRYCKPDGIVHFVPQSGETRLSAYFHALPAGMKSKLRSRTFHFTHAAF